MVRLILFLLAVVAVASGLAWLADRPGSLILNWEGYEVETSVFRAVVILAALTATAIFLWSLARQVWNSPAAVGQFVTRRRQKRGLEALSTGMIAIGAGDKSAATRYAIQARKSLPNEPLTHLLRAQAAQLSGDKQTSRRIFEAMLGSPDTEALGLRGLFLEAQREGEQEAARNFAERALRLNPKLGWPADALFELQCKASDWAGALDTLAVAKRHGQMDRATIDRRRGVLLTAQAIQNEESNPELALNRAIEAHGLAPDLVPAASLAARMLASRGNTARAAKIIQKTWAKTPHPDLAQAYAFARIGDSPRDRLERVRQLSNANPHSIEGPIAVATAAIDAKLYDEARDALAHLSDSRLTQRVCLLMARIEGEQHGDKGRVREWLARAVNAPRDPAWTADGVVSEAWAPLSPVSGALDAFQWKVPVESLDKGEDDTIARKLEELVGLGAKPAVTLTARDVVPVTDVDEVPPTVRPAAEKAAQAVAPSARMPEPARAAEAPQTAVKAEPQAVDAAKPAVVEDAVVVHPAAAPVAKSEPKVEAKAAPAPASTAAPAAAKAAIVVTTETNKAPIANPAQPATAVSAPKAVDTPKAAASAAVAAQPAAAVKQGNGATQGKGSVKPTAAKPPVFVTPPVPDDPGPDGDDGEDRIPPPRRTYRAS